ncbi:MAG TPA: DNRLRE domain-containing protein [Bacillota bacterium]|nr:DNRLRE domain-containing protein [Bacillota bacterium]HOK70556.1 DNRLRE domain-containing protein [Bacillota bacterium]HOL51012.1 DNRLRE domain-containing protein [Bacillota bacterium]HOO29932.1 DNRLRE domain-containing protein [Bacillota bacterium]HPQ01796.1 DNRLRE domain-containing protein [Bacillota bacterium]
MKGRHFGSRLSLLAVICAFCLTTSGCNMGDYTFVDLPVRVAWEPDQLIRVIDSEKVFGHRLGRGDGLRVWLDLGPLPCDLEPESIERATLKLPCQSFSRVAGAVTFEIYMVKWTYDSGMGEWPDIPEFLHSSELPNDVQPISSARLSHDVGWETQHSNGYVYSSQYIDTEVKYLSFDITEAIKAWVSGTPNAGLRIKQKSPARPDGPVWSLLMAPDKRLKDIHKALDELPKSANGPSDQPIAIVCIKKAGEAS